MSGQLREDRLAVAVGPEPGVEVEEADPLPPRHMLGQQPAPIEVGPGGRVAAVEDAVGVRVLPATDGALVGREAVLGNVGRDATVRGLPRRPVPVGREQQRMNRVVIGLLRVGPAVVDEVAVEVDVVLGHPPRVGEAVGVHRMNQEQATLLRPFADDGLAQEADLAARAQESLHAVGRGGDDVKQLGIRRPEPRDIGIERAAVRSGGVGVQVMGEDRARLGAGIQEFSARLDIVGGEMTGDRQALRPRTRPPHGRCARPPRAGAPPARWRR